MHPHTVAGHIALVAVGTATIDGIRPGQRIREIGFVGDVPGESNDLSVNRRGGQGDIAISQGTSEADDILLIKTTPTGHMHRATYRTAGLIDTASNRQGGHPRRGRRAELPIA